jgi:hypothetical protein
MVRVGGFYGLGVCSPTAGCSPTVKIARFKVIFEYYLPKRGRRGSGRSCGCRGGLSCAFRDNIIFPWAIGAED